MLYSIYFILCGLLHIVDSKINTTQKHVDKNIKSQFSYKVPHVLGYVGSASLSQANNMTYFTHYTFSESDLCAVNFRNVHNVHELFALCLIS